MSEYICVVSLTHSHSIHPFFKYNLQINVIPILSVHKTIVVGNIISISETIFCMDNDRKYGSKEIVGKQRIETQRNVKSQSNQIVKT